MPAALQREHRVADRTWGRLRVLAGTVGFAMDTDAVTAVELDAGATQPIPPGVGHALRLRGPVTLEVDFLSRLASTRDEAIDGSTPPRKV